MCQFLSAVYTRNKKLICLPEYTDSHSELLLHSGIKERNTDAPVQQFVRLELTPPNDWSLDLEQWREDIDEHETPSWFDDALRFDAFEGMRDVIRGAIVTSDRGILLGGFWILSGEAKVNVARNCRIRAMLDSSQIGEMLGSSQVGEMLGSSQVGEMLGSSQVGEMLGSSQVGEMLGSSQVGKMLDSSQVGEMLGSSQVGEMLGSSQVGKMWGSSQVGKDARYDKSNGCEVKLRETAITK